VEQRVVYRWAEAAVAQGRCVGGRIVDVAAGLGAEEKYRKI